MREVRVKSEQRVKQTSKREQKDEVGGDRKGFGVGIYRERQKRELKMTSTYRKRERRGGKSESKA